MSSKTAGHWKKAVHIRYNFTCQHCGEKEDPMNRSFEVHHIIPRAEGGTNDPSNTILLCKECHRAVHKRAVKKAKYYDKILGLGEEYNEERRNIRKHRFRRIDDIHGKFRREIKIRLKELTVK